MKRCLVTSSKLRGRMEAPPSKSHSLRALLFGALGKGKSAIYGPLFSPDSQAMIEACCLLGARVEVFSNYVEVVGIGGKIGVAEDVIQAGNSGIVLRFCSAIGALGRHPIVITGDSSIRHQRPMKPLIEALSQLGVWVRSMRGDGYAPIVLQGPILHSKATFCGRDSQPVSALLIAAAFAEFPIEFFVKEPGEKPWVALTLDWFERLGIPYFQRDFSYYRLAGAACYRGFEYEVPGDFSSAAFPLVAAVVTQSEVEITNLDMSDSQGDKRVIGFLQKMGAVIEIDEKKKSLYVKGKEPLVGQAIDVNDCIDAIAILAVAACFAEGETLLYNGKVAREKECDRIKCMAQELRKMGAFIEEGEDGLLIKRSFLKGADLDSHGDHRIAMALIVAALAAKGQSSINGISCIAKTFPTFLQDFVSLGAKINGLIS